MARKNYLIDQDTPPAVGTVVKYGRYRCEVVGVERKTKKRDSRRPGGAPAGSEFWLVRWKLTHPDKADPIYGVSPLRARWIVRKTAEWKTISNRAARPWLFDYTETRIDRGETVNVFDPVLNEHKTLRFVFYEIHVSDGGSRNVFLWWTDQEGNLGRTKKRAKTINWDPPTVPDYIRHIARNAPNLAGRFADASAADAPPAGEQYVDPLVEAITRATWARRRPIHFGGFASVPEIGAVGVPPELRASVAALLQTRVRETPMDGREGRPLLPDPATGRPLSGLWPVHAAD